MPVSAATSTSPITGDIVVRLIPLNQRPGIATVMQRLNDRIVASVPGVGIDIHQLINDNIGDLTGVPQPIEVKLSATDPAALAPAAQRVTDALGKVPGVNSVISGIVPAGDAINIHVDPVRAAMLGLDPATVAASLDTELAGTVATQVQGTLQQIGVRVVLPPGAVQNTDDLKTIPIATPSGKLVPLGDIARFQRCGRAAGDHA